jgi:putative lipoic acid-binding regulatory protein
VVKPVKNTKFDEFLEFPCPFTFKIMGLANVSLTDQVIAKLQAIVPGDYSPKVKPSSKGTYESITIVATVGSKEDIEQIYTEVGGLEDVRYVL